MKVWPTLAAASCAITFVTTTAPAQQFVIQTTTALSQDTCFWGGVPYSAGARIRGPLQDRDPHVIAQYFTCHNGTWAQD